MDRWDKNWIIHLDGVFQTADRGGDHHVHVAKGLRRLAILDTMEDVEPGFVGEPSRLLVSASCPMHTACLT